MQDILELSLAAWYEVPESVFQAAWVVCGYVEPSHFSQFEGVPVISSSDHAQSVIDPAGVLHNAGLRPTPQWCTEYEWQIQDEL